MKTLLVQGRVIDPASGIDAVRDLAFADGVIVDLSRVDESFTRIDCAGRVISPGFVDLHAVLAEPTSGAKAALTGGFTTVVTSPANPAPVERPVDVRDLLARSVGSAVNVRVAAALTVGLRGEEIADVGLLCAAGAAVLSNGSTPVRNARVLRNLLEYAGRFKRPVMLRAAEVDLEAGGVVREGPRAAWLGLPSVPPEAEEIGVGIVAALVRRTGTPVHLTHLWSRRGVEELRRARAEGLPVTGSTTAHHVAIDDAMIDELAYSGVCRFVPPLGDDSDRRALREALVDGTLSAVASDHRPVPLHLQDRELEFAVPGSVGFETAFALTLFALGDLGQTVAALATGPSGLMGPVATLAVGAAADVVVLNPDRSWVVAPPILCAAPYNTPLRGRTLVGAVDRAFVAGHLAFVAREG